MEPVHSTAAQQNLTAINSVSFYLPCSENVPTANIPLTYSVAQAGFYLQNSPLISNLEVEFGLRDKIKTLFLLAVPHVIKP